MEPVSITNFLNSSEFSIPLGQVVLFALLSSLCLAAGRHKLGLLVSFSFAFYWGFIFNRQYFISLIGESTGLYIYSFCGLIMLVLAIIGFMQDPS